MKKRISITTAVAVFVGLLLMSLPGMAALQVGTQTSGQPGYGYQAPAAQAAKQEDPLPELFLRTLAGKLGISVDQLKQAIRATKNELIKERLEQAVKAGRLTPEQAKKLGQRLSQAGPRELARLMLRLRERARELQPAPTMPRLGGKPMKRGMLLGPGYPRQPEQPMMAPRGMPHGQAPAPYYHPFQYRPYPMPPIYGYGYSYSCTCYCSLPPLPYFYPWPQPQQYGPQAPFQFWPQMQKSPQEQPQKPQTPGWRYQQQEHHQYQQPPGSQGQ